MGNLSRDTVFMTPTVSLGSATATRERGLKHDDESDAVGTVAGATLVVGFGSIERLSSGGIEFGETGCVAAPVKIHDPEACTEASSSSRKPQYPHQASRASPPIVLV